MFYIFKVDLALGGLFCSEKAQYSSDIVTVRCEKIPDFRSISATLSYPMCFLSLLMNVVTVLVIIIVYTNVDFQNQNLLKQKFSWNQMFDYFVLLLSVVWSHVYYFPNQIIVVFIFVYICYLLFAYFRYFPVVGKDIVGIYGGYQLSIIMILVLMTIREYQGHDKPNDELFLKDEDLFYDALLLLPIMFGMMLILSFRQYQVRVQMNIADAGAKKEFSSIIIYLQELNDLYQESSKNPEKFLKLLGIIEVHQVRAAPPPHPSATAWLVLRSPTHY